MIERQALRAGRARGPILEALINRRLYQAGQPRPDHCGDAAADRQNGDLPSARPGRGAACVERHARRPARSARPVSSLARPSRAACSRFCRAAATPKRANLFQGLFKRPACNFKVRFVSNSRARFLQERRLWDYLMVVAVVLPILRCRRRRRLPCRSHGAADRPEGRPLGVILDRRRQAGRVRRNHQRQRADDDRRRRGVGATFHARRRYVGQRLRPCRHHRFRSGRRRTRPGK